MYKRIDGDETSMPSGFIYSNQDGDIEGVHLDGETVDIGLQHGDRRISSEGFTAYVDDLPNLIKALQAAYHQMKGEQA